MEPMPPLDLRALSGDGPYIEVDVNEAHVLSGYAMQRRWTANRVSAVQLSQVLNTWDENDVMRSQSSAPLESARSTKPPQVNSGSGEYCGYSRACGCGVPSFCLDSKMVAEMKLHQQIRVPGGDRGVRGATVDARRPSAPARASTTKKSVRWDDSTTVTPRITYRKQGFGLRKASKQQTRPGLPLERSERETSSRRIPPASNAYAAVASGDTTTPSMPLPEGFEFRLLLERSERGSSSLLLEGSERGGSSQTTLPPSNARAAVASGATAKPLPPLPRGFEFVRDAMNVPGASSFSGSLDDDAATGRATAATRALPPKYEEMKGVDQLTGSTASFFSRANENEKTTVPPDLRSGVMARGGPCPPAGTSGTPPSPLARGRSNGARPVSMANDHEARKKREMEVLAEAFTYGAASSTTPPPAPSQDNASSAVLLPRTHRRGDTVDSAILPMPSSMDSGDLASSGSTAGGATSANATPAMASEAASPMDAGAAMPVEVGAATHRDVPLPRWGILIHIPAYVPGTRLCATAHNAGEPFVVAGAAMFMPGRAQASALFEVNLRFALDASLQLRITSPPSSTALVVYTGNGRGAIAASSSRASSRPSRPETPAAAAAAGIEAAAPAEGMRLVGGMAVADMAMGIVAGSLAGSVGRVFGMKSIPAVAAPVPAREPASPRRGSDVTAAGRNGVRSATARVSAGNAGHTAVGTGAAPVKRSWFRRLSPAVVAAVAVAAVVIARRRR